MSISRLNNLGYSPFYYLPILQASLVVTVTKKSRGKKRKQVCLNFHRIGPLGRFDLVVTKSVPDCVCVFCVRELVHATLVRELVHASVALAWSPKNREVFRIGRRNVGIKYCRNVGI